MAEAAVGSDTDINNDTLLLFPEIQPSMADIYIIKGVMFVCLSVCLFVPYGRPNGRADRDQT